MPVFPVFRRKCLYSQWKASEWNLPSLTRRAWQAIRLAGRVGGPKRGAGPFIWAAGRSDHQPACPEHLTKSPRGLKQQHAGCRRPRVQQSRQLESEDYFWKPATSLYLRIPFMLGCPPLGRNEFRRKPGTFARTVGGLGHANSISRARRDDLSWLVVAGSVRGHCF